MRYHKLLIAAAGVAAFAAAPALAQSAKANFGQVISSIQSSKKEATEIQSLTTVKDVNVVKISELADDGNKSALDQALTKNDADIQALRTALTSNSAVNTALTQANVQVAAVVAADIMPDGAITVYVR
jgi:hypothetical protein